MFLNVVFVSQSSSDSRCPRGCVYTLSTNPTGLFCFEPAGEEPVTSC